MVRAAWWLVLAGCSSAGPATLLHNSGGQTTLMFRELTPRGSNGNVLDAFTLTREGERVTLTASGRESGSLAVPLREWREVVHGSMQGTARESAGTVQLTFERPDAKSPLVMSCTEKVIDVAPPTAVRTMGEHVDCGAPVKWSLPTERVRVLACVHGDAALEDVYAPPPGIERVRLLDVFCHRADHAYRRVAGDGSVAPPRRY